MSSDPARLVLVVGPSGAGKDTLMRAAAALLMDAPDIVFVRRAITRISDASEDHDSLTPEAFAAMVEEGAFALHWSAHGLDYGIPRAGLRTGGVAVCNGSRAIAGQARALYPHSQIVLVTAPPEVLAARLRARGRESAIEDRLNRQVARESWQADLVIDNSGPVAAGAQRLADFLRAQSCHECRLAEQATSA